jgi:hypothetical protein
MRAVQVVHKKLWIGQVMHAETVTPIRVMHAETVTATRRNGHATNKEPVSTCNQYTFSKSCAYWGQPCRLPTKRLALATNSRF